MEFQTLHLVSVSLVHVDEHGAVVRVLDSGPSSRGFDPHTGQGSLLKLWEFHLPQYTQLQMSANIVGKVTCNALVSCAGELAKLHTWQNKTILILIVACAK